MSRTYRKLPHYEEYSLYWDWDFDIHSGFTKTKKVPTKKELAIARRDKSNWRNKKYWFKQISRVRRMDDRNQLQKVYRIDDFDGYYFDNSHTDIFDSYVWWIIN